MGGATKAQGVSIDTPVIWRKKINMGASGKNVNTYIYFLLCNPKIKQLGSVVVCTSHESLMPSLGV